MVKVLTILSGLDGGGVENILLNYYKSMDKTKVHMDIVVHSQYEGKLEKSFLELGCKIFRVTPKTVSLKKNIIDIYNILHDNNYDVIHSRMNVKGLTHLITAWICGVKVRMIHNHMAYVPKVGKMKYLTPPAKILCKLFATHWLACSNDAAIDMFGKKAFEKGKVIVLPNAIQVEKYDFNREKRKVQRKLWNLEDYYVIGIVGRFHDQKNYQFMIRIFKYVVDQYSKARLMIVGGGELDREVHSWVREYGVEDKVIFTGIRNDVPDLLQAMDIFVLPTKYEGFGNVLIEAQAASLHTITSLEGVPKSTRVTDLIEYISLNEDPSIWAERILNFKDGYNRISRKQAIKAAGFDVNEQVKTLENLYIESSQK